MSNNTINYGEVICQAVDSIVSAKLQGLEYDITKLCTIIDDSCKSQGKYIVSDGSARFEAYSTDQSFRKGNSVLVTIPNGDYKMQKTISGRVSADNTEPFNYTSPLDNMLKMTSNILNDIEVIYGENPGLLANDEGSQYGTMIGPIYSISEPGAFAGFSRLGIGANFRSWLSEFGVVAGVYGIKMLIYTDTISSPGVPNKNTVYELTFNTEDMIGNPYQFDTYFYQEKVFDISTIHSINQIDLYFYQDGQFYDGNGQYIKWQADGDSENIGLEPSKLPMNLFVSDIEIFLGYASGEFTKETLMIGTGDGLTYHYLTYPPFTGSGKTKTVSLRWIHKIDNNNNFELLNGNNLDTDRYEVRWFRYNPGWDKVDKYAGKDWQQLEPDANPFSCTFTPDIENQREEIKAIGLIKENVTLSTDTLLKTNEEFKDRYDSMVEAGADRDQLEELRGEYTTTTSTHYISNILVFENEEHVPDAITKNVSTQLSIVCEDESDGNYFIYDQNGKIINQGQGQGYERRLSVRYKGAIIEPDLGSLDYVAWYIPYESKNSNTHTMLVTNEAYWKENGGSYQAENGGPIIETYQGVQYIVIKRYPDDYGAINPYQTYSLKNTWYQANNNNVIRCLLSMNGVVYEAVSELKFGKAGSQGTNITVVLDFMHGKNAYEIDNDKEDFFIEAIMYDMAGTRITSYEGQWEWSILNSDYLIYTQDTDNENFILDPNIIKLNWNTEKYAEKIVPIDNYTIVEAKYVQANATTLIARAPVPIKKNKYSHIEGAREVIYNSQGIPSYYTDAYILYELDKSLGTYNKVQDIEWYLGYNKEDLNLKDENGNSTNKISTMTESYIPKLRTFVKENIVYKALSASPFYASGYSDKICVCCGQPKLTEGGSFIGEFKEIYWSQPILIMQSQYDFAMLNEWDGKLQTDENTGVIMSTMLGAGRKNKNNTFSGVLIGDIQDGTDLIEGGSYIKVVLDKDSYEKGKYYFQPKESNTYYLDYSDSFDATKVYYELQSLTGVYGFHEGVISYSLKENGIATFGKAGKGQIVINGNDSTIMSASYKDLGSGMKLDLDDGILHIQDENRTKIRLQPDDPYLQIYGNGELPIMHVGSLDYYLQSDNYLNGAGFGSKLDLVNGTFQIKSTSGHITISGHDDYPFFQIIDKDQKTLINMSKNQYILQSSQFDGTTPVTIENGVYVIYQNKDNEDEYAAMSLNNSAIFKATKSGDSYERGTEITDFPNEVEIETGIDNEGNPIKEIVTVDEGTAKNLYMSKLIPVLEPSEKAGLRIDLNTGRIEGYNLYLSGTGAGGDFILSSIDPTTPFKIGQNFYVNWSGALYCTDIGFIGNVSNTGAYKINIGNGLKVTSDGRGYFAGTSENANYANEAGYADRAGYAYQAYQADYATKAGDAETVGGQKGPFALEGHKHALTAVVGSVYVPSQSAVGETYIDAGYAQYIINQNGLTVYATGYTKPYSIPVTIENIYGFSLGPAT